MAIIRAQIAYFVKIKLTIQMTERSEAATERRRIGSIELGRYLIAIIMFAPHRWIMTLWDICTWIIR
ncbi:MAG: hypothetical protein GY797_21355 [Deltaproteobacteria bacterium]|nr:hypothetical protein [Deltaproteobacteria bacterium]